MVPAAFGGLRWARGLRREERDQVNLWESAFGRETEIAKRLLPRTWPQLTWRNAGTGLHQVADGLGNQLRGNLPISLCQQAGVEEC